MSAKLRLCLVFVLLSSTLASAAVLENPSGGDFYSGVGVISGWKCEANGPLTVRFNGGSPIPLAYLNERPDTAEVCGDTNNGFVAIWNWARLGDGTHIAVAYDNGVEFDRATFEVATAGEEFVRGAVGECSVSNFPALGETTLFAWNQNTQHLEMVPLDPLATPTTSGPRPIMVSHSPRAPRGLPEGVNTAPQSARHHCVEIFLEAEDRDVADNSESYGKAHPVYYIRNNCPDPVTVLHGCPYPTRSTHPHHICDDEEEEEGADEWTEPPWRVGMHIEKSVYLEEGASARLWGNIALSCPSRTWLAACATETQNPFDYGLNPYFIADPLKLLDSETRFICVREPHPPYYDETGCLERRIQSHQANDDWMVGVR